MKKKKNPIYGDSLKVERNDSLFFCALSFPTIIFFCFSFELYGKLVRVSFGSICYLLGFNQFQPYLKQFVSRLETIRFSVWNKVFPVMKQSVSKHETDRRLVGYESPSCSLRLFCQHLSCLTHIWNQKNKVWWLS